MVVYLAPERSLCYFLELYIHSFIHKFKSVGVIKVKAKLSHFVEGSSKSRRRASKMKKGDVLLKKNQTPDLT